MVNDEEELKIVAKQLQATSKNLHFIQSQQSEIITTLRSISAQIHSLSIQIQSNSSVTSHLHIPHPRAFISVSSGLGNGSTLSINDSGVEGFCFVKSESLGTESYQSENVVAGPSLVDCRSRVGASIDSSTRVEDDNAVEDDALSLKFGVTKSDKTKSSDLRESLAKLFAMPIARSRSSLICIHWVCSEKFSLTEAVEHKPLGWKLEAMCRVFDASPGPRTDHVLARDKPPPWPPPRILRSNEEQEKLSLNEELGKLTPTQKITRVGQIRLAVDAMEFGVMMRFTTQLAEELLDCDKPPPWPPPTSSDLFNDKVFQTKPGAQNEIWGLESWSSATPSATAGSGVVARRNQRRRLSLLGGLNPICLTWACGPKQYKECCLFILQLLLPPPGFGKN